MNFKLKNSIQIKNFKFQITQRGFCVFPRKLQRYSAIIILALLVISALVVILWANLHAPKVQAAWWDDAWGYRQTVTLTNNGSAQTNYQVQVVLGTGDLILAGKMQTNCNDVRFVDQTGKAIQYWQEYCATGAGKSSSYWLLMTSLPAGTTQVFVYYGNPGAASTSTYSSAPTGINVGTGNDGIITVSSDTVINTTSLITGRSCADGGDAVNYSVTENRASGTNQIVLSSTPASGCLAAGDEVLIINLQGAVGNTANVGQYEFARINSISVATLTLNRNLTNGYDGTTQKIMVQRMPNYSSVTVNSAINFTPAAWNGTKNGVMAFRVNGTVTATGNIHANFLGYRGGSGGAAGVNGGVNGESYDGSAVANIGRGGSGASAGETKGGGRAGDGAVTSPNNGAVRGGGGGGGSDGSTATTGRGTGAGGGAGGGYGGGGGGGAGGGDQFGDGGTGGTGGSTGTAAGGGGAGCYDNVNFGHSGNGGNAGSAGGNSNADCATSSTGGQVGSGTTGGSGGGAGANSLSGGGGGGGGGTYGSTTLSTIFMGSGGGGGGGVRSTDTAGADGKAGGGIVYVAATTVTVTGTVAATGTNGTVNTANGSGGGGAGAGGSIYLGGSTVTFGTTLVTALGGSSGGQAGKPGGAGGAGGVGRIHADYSTSTGTTNPTVDTATLPVAGSPSTEEKTVQPVVYWKMDEGQGTTLNSSTATASATLQGAITAAIPTWQTEDLCVSGKCLYFEGSSATASATVSLLGLQTISFWAKPASSSGSIPLISLKSGTGEVAITSSNLTVSAPGISSPTIYVNGAQNTNLSANKWNYVTVTSATGFNAINPVLGLIQTTYFKGFMDEVKFYNYARSQAQINADYNSRTGTSRGNSAAIGAASNDALQKGLVGYWKMDETASPSLDSSGNSASGTWTGTVTSATGKYGNAVSFSGSSGNYVSVPNSTALGPNNIALNVWVKPASTTQTNGAAIITKGNGNGGEVYSLDVVNSVGNCASSTSKYRFYVWKSGFYYQACSLSDITTSWTHVVAMADGLNLYLYINGTLEATTPFNASLDTNSHVVSIGCRQSGSTTYDSCLNGAIDEARIYNRSLTPSEVTQLYNFAPGPVGYWDFDERTGSVLDKSGNGNNGTWGGTGTTRYIQGKFGAAGNFNGSDDKVTVTNPTIMNLTGPMTISAWVKPTDFSTYRGVVVKGTGCATGVNCPFDTYFSPTTGTFNFIRANASVYYATRSTDPVSAGVWSHVEIVDDGATHTYYINGVKSTTVVVNGTYVTPTTNSSDLQIGLRSDSVTKMLGGIDEIKIYNYARTQKQVIEDMNGGHPGGGSPVGSAMDYWKFDEGQGTTTYDSGSNPNNGTLTNMATTASVGISGWNPNGKFNKAISFDGSNDHVDFGDLSWTEGQSTISASLWVNPNSLAQKICLLCKFQQASAANKESIAIETGVTNGNAVMMEISTDGNTATASGETPAGALTVGKWTHIVAVYDGGQSGTNANALQIYINGIKQKLTFSGTIPSATWATTSNFRAGASSDSTPARLFSGTIDEVKMYASALTASDVLIDYNHSQSVNFGVLGVNSADAKTASNSASTIYCVPGDTSSCSTPMWEVNFEEGAGATLNDSSGNGYNSTWNGTGGHWTAGYYGKAGLFSSSTSDYFFSPNMGTPPTKFTEEAWIKPTSAGGVIFTETNTATINTNYHYSQMEVETTGIVKACVWTGSLFTCVNAGTVPFNVWSHVAMTYGSGGSNNTLIGYVNGVVGQTTTSAYSPPAGPANLIKGVGATDTSNQGNGSYFSGAMDGIRLYNYVRTPAQIAYEYNRGLPVSWWKMDECSGTTLNDSISGTNSATLSIGTAGNAQTSAGTCTDGLSTSAWNNGKSGKFNYSINLDGADDKATVTTGINYVQSVGFWVKPASSSGTIPFIALATSPAINVTSSNLVVSATGWTSPTIYVNGQKQTSLTANAWNHVVVTSATSNSANAITFGFISPTWFKGQMDEVKIWNYQLTDYQVRTEFNQGSAVRFGPLTGSP